MRIFDKGPFKCYIMQRGGGWVGVSDFPEKALCFNIISITRGWVGITFPANKHYVTFEWPVIHIVCRRLQMDIDTRCSLCGQLMGMVMFFKHMTGAPPVEFTLQKCRFALKHVGSFTMVRRSLQFFVHESNHIV